MKVIRLQSNNVMRLVAVDITPAGHLVTIGGKNGAGKSSVLNSLAMALGGAQMAPVEPIRAGEAEAVIRVTLEDLIITRRFYREKELDVPGAGDAKEFWGETKSTLTVTNKEGAKYPSPQAMLDKLLGKLTFDPLAFSRDEPKRQEETLRRLVKLDTTAIDTRRKEAFDARAMAKKSHDIKVSQAMALKQYDDAPTAEISMEEISKDMLQAEEYRKLAEEAERVVSQAKEEALRLQSQRTRMAEKITQLREQLKKADEEQATMDQAIELGDRDIDAKQITAQAARAVVPDVEVLRKKLAETEATNIKVRANLKFKEAENEVATLAKHIDDHDAKVKAADAEKEQVLRDVQFPVPGLGIADAGVTFNGLPFSQASTAEQLRVSVAIGLALNPTLKVLLIRSGNLLDDDSLKLVADQVEAADAQVWMEYVTSDKGDVSVMIEDGHVS